MKHNLILSTMMAAGVLTSAVYANDDTTTPDDIEVISVWSTSVNSSSLYMMGKDIADKQADHISDLLRILPGVDVGGAHSLNQRITIRAMDDKDLNIRIDGATQNTYMYHHMGNLQIHADILKSVDIEVGTNSVINGGLGGSVRFETKQASELLDADRRFGVRAAASVQSNSGHNGSITAYGLLTDNVDFLAYHNTVTRDNYDVGGGEILDANGAVIDGTDGTVRGLEGDIQDTLVKFGWNINADQRITLGYENYQDEGEYSFRPDMGLATDLAITNSLGVPLLWPTEFTRDTLTLNYNANIGEDTVLTASLYDNTSELYRDENGWSQSPPFAASAGIVTGEATNTGLNVLAETVIQAGGEHQLTYGVDLNRHETAYQFVGATTNRSAEEAQSDAIFVQDRFTLSDSVTLIGGLRYDNYDMQANVADQSFSEVTYSIGVELQPSENFVYKLSRTSLFKGPEIAEVFIGAGSRDRANADIEAETGSNTEIAFVYQDSLFGADSASIGATLFHTQINDYLYDYAPVPGGGPRDSWKDNIGDMTIEGYEIAFNLAHDAFSAQLTFSSAKSELDAFADYASLDGARIDREQGNGLGLSLAYTLNNVDLSWETINVNDVAAGINLDGATMNNAKDGYQVHNVAVSWSPESVTGLAVVLGVDNVFDEFYASQASRTGTSFHPRFGPLYLLDYEPGRNVKLTASYTF